MITVAIIDESRPEAERITELLTAYSIRKDLDFRTLWFSTEQSLQKLRKYAPGIHIAMISLQKLSGMDAGKEIYSANPECRIIYYSTTSCDLEALLPSRPIAFHLWANNDSMMLGKLDTIIKEVLHANALFYYQTRKQMLLIPEREILFLQSNLKTVEIHRAHDETELINAKLSAMEERLSCRFVRVHQSFIVNLDHIQAFRLDKHVVILQNGETIPISDARYQYVIGKIHEWGEEMLF